MNRAVYYTVLIALCSSTVKSQSCEANDNEPGTCLSLYDCRYIVHLIRDGKRRVAYFDDHFAVCCGHGDGQYICCSNRSTTTPETILTTTENNIDNTSETATPDVPGARIIEDISNHLNLNLLPTTCGIIRNDWLAFGENTALNEFPFMALLRYETSEGLKFQCLGTIINKRYILTAARCASGPRRKLVSVRVGEHEISKTIDCVIFFGKEYCAPAVDDIDIEEIKVHPRYNIHRFANDIAVIRLSRDINLNNSNMQTICLPINDETQYQSLVNVIAAGWGPTETNLRYGRYDIPLKAILPIVDPIRCQQQYGSTRILEYHICAGGVNQIDTCPGDFGGPVFYAGRVHNSLRYVQYGIVAGGHRLCRENDDIPGLYTSISYYMKWILDQLRP